MPWNSPVSSVRTATASIRSSSSARYLETSESCPRDWLAADAVETGERPGITRAKRDKPDLLGAEPPDVVTGVHAAEASLAASM